jgi:uncharacterized delta-60 repeat protein
MTPAGLNRRRILNLAGVLAVVIATASPGAAAAGDLDPTFDEDGMVTTDFGSDAAWAWGIAIQEDGKLVAAGVTYNGPPSDHTDFALVRYNQDGSSDTTLGTDGKVTTDFAGRDDEVQAVAIQKDGKIVVAGSAYLAGTLLDFALARYNQDGSLDTTFGTDGKVTTDFAFNNDGGVALAIQGDGKIVIAGYMNVPERFGIDFALARYNPDGSLDPTFDGDGKVTTDFAGSSDVASSLAIQSDGKIVAAGRAGGSGIDFALARYNDDGSLDTTFDGDGKVTTDFVTPAGSSRGDFAQAVAIQGDRKIVAAGYSIASRDFDFALARYNPDGSLDVELGHYGTVNTDLGSIDDSAHGLAIQRDGKIVVSGTTTVTETRTADFALVRYTPDGFLDPTFGGGDGTVMTDFAGGDDAATAVAIQRDAKIVAAGDADGQFAVARYTVCRRTSRKSSISCR